MGLGGEDFEFFAGELRVGDGEEGLVGLGLFGGEILVAEDGVGCGGCLCAEDGDSGEEKRGEEDSDARGHD